MSFDCFGFASYGCIGPYRAYRSDENATSGQRHPHLPHALPQLLRLRLWEQSRHSFGAALPGNNSISLKPLSFNPGFASVSGVATGKASGYDQLIHDASRRHGVESSLVKAVIDAESSFDTRAVSRAGAKGLMQLMDSTGKSLGVSDPFDPAQNIQGGTQYLSNLLQKYNGNRGVALAAYNAGPGRIDRLGITNDQQLMANMHLLPNETQNYVNKVMKLQRNYEV